MKNKSRLPFTIIDKKSGAIAGSTSFGNISFRDKRLEIGWTWIAKDYQGKGINDQIKYLMMEYAFGTLGFERVEFKTDVLNTFSRRALLRIGATEEGILRNHMLMTHNRRRDTIYYSVLRSEWEEKSY
jgi:RimJ/RimL family protein N-acetyltransferase